MPIFVIPVKFVLDLIGERESSVFNELRIIWIPACAGMTTFYESIIVKGSCKAQSASGLGG
jgi:hypothetical protein